MSTRPTSAPPARERRLRAILADHNFRTALLATLTLIAAALAWWALHGVVHWLALLFVSVARGTEAKAPPHLDEVFWSIAAALLAIAWIDRYLHPDTRPRDRKTGPEIAWEFLLAIPRLTLAAGGTLSAWQRLDDHEIADAIGLIERLEHEPRILHSRMPLEIPDEARRAKILFALQILQVIDITREDHELWVRLSPLRPLSLKTAVSPRDRPPAFGP